MNVTNESPPGTGVTASPPPPESVADKQALEVYRAAVARLSYQDEHLFKFSALHLTAQGALAVFVGTVVFKGVLPNYVALVVVSVVGAFLASSWALWTHHNDYWHSVWVGVLRRIEGSLATSVRAFATDDKSIALDGGRSKRYVMNGHHIALLLPIGIAAIWVICLVVALWRVVCHA